MADTGKIQIFDTWIRESGKIVISSHLHPDGDAVGSSCALACYLKDRGKDVAVVLPDPVPDNLCFAISPDTAALVCSDLRTCTELIAGADLIVSIDYNRPDRTAGLADAITASKARKVLIDHHLFPDCGTYGLVFSTPHTSSSCEVLYGILRDMPGVDGEIGKAGVEVCRLLMLGMTTDTNNFANSTLPSTLRMASDLLAAGVDRQGLLSGLYESYRENRLRFMGFFLKDRLKLTQYGLAYAVVTSEDMEDYDIREGETEGFVNMPLGIARVRMSILLRQDGDGFRVSIRSKRGVSANRCASMYFNGGGHENASGGRLAAQAESPAAARILMEKYIEDCCEVFFKDEKLWKSES
ncbi:MAG: bifunctional oligoribonuclease/PAP phosphatase NrnA [Candidatus Cryptobacteroides sp.]